MEHKENTSSTYEAIAVALCCLIGAVTGLVAGILTGFTGMGLPLVILLNVIVGSVGGFWIGAILCLLVGCVVDVVRSE